MFKTRNNYRPNFVIIATRFAENIRTQCIRGNGLRASFQNEHLPETQLKATRRKEKYCRDSVAFDPQTTRVVRPLTPTLLLRR